MEVLALMRLAVEVKQMEVLALGKLKVKQMEVLEVGLDHEINYFPLLYLQ
jgi:hypothetical protein